MFFPYCGRSSLEILQKYGQNYSFYIVDKKQIILGWMVVRIPRIESVLNFLMNAILIY
jgi:hypothetical protein